MKKNIMMMGVAALFAFCAQAATSTASYNFKVLTTLEYTSGKADFQTSDLQYYTCYSMSADTVKTLLGTTVSSGQAGVDQVMNWLLASYVQNGSAWMNAGIELANSLTKVDSGTGLMDSGSTSYSGSGSTATAAKNAAAKSALTANEFTVLFYHKDDVNAFRILRADLTDAADYVSTGRLTGSHMDGKTKWVKAADGPGPIPEPTSAMLMLLGVAGLALKRKQK